MEGIRPNLGAENKTPQSPEERTPDYHDTELFHAEQLAHFLEMRRMIQETFPDSEGHHDSLDWVNEQIRYHQGRIIELGDPNAREN